LKASAFKISFVLKIRLPPPLRHTANSGENLGKYMCSLIYLTTEENASRKDNTNFCAVAALSLWKVNAVKVIFMLQKFFKAGLEK